MESREQQIELKMKKSISDYRVIEKPLQFTVQKKTTVVTTVGRFLNKKNVTTEFWDSLSSEGSISFGSFKNTPGEAKVYDTLEKAKEAIESFIKYPIFHYFKSDLELAKMPKDSIG